MSILDLITSLFAPDSCLTCRREGSLLCSACSDTLAQPKGICFGCFASAPNVACTACLAKSGCSSLLAVTDYSGSAKQLVASLKFLGNQSAAAVMARRMQRTVSTLPPDTLITHVPATAAHIRQRGFDQAELLAKQLSRRLNMQRLTALARYGSRHQLGADNKTRRAQLTHALRIRRSATIAGRHILLVDDVLTTGSSVQAAATALLRAGAVSVDVLVFAQSVKAK